MLQLMKVGKTAEPDTPLYQVGDKVITSHSLGLPEHTASYVAVLSEPHSEPIFLVEQQCIAEHL